MDPTTKYIVYDLSLNCNAFQTVLPCFGANCDLPILAFLKSPASLTDQVSAAEDGRSIWPPRSAEWPLVVGTRNWIGAFEGRFSTRFLHEEVKQAGRGWVSCDGQTVGVDRDHRQP